MEPSAVFAMTGLFIVTIISPGPNMFLVVQARLSGGPDSSNAVISGMVSADLAWGFGAVLGIFALLERVPQLVALCQLAGGTWLFVIGYRSLIQSRRDPTTSPDRRCIGFGDGFASAGLNPSHPILFAAALPSLLGPVSPSPAQAVAIAVLYAGLAAGWFSAVAALTARRSGKTANGPLSRIVERLPPLALMGFGFAFVAGV